MDCSIFFSGNPDISGIGVRTSFYVQTTLLVLQVNRSWEDAGGALWTLNATSFGLTVAALVQLHDQQLSFFHALQISNLVWLSNCATFLAMASYSRRSPTPEERSRPATQDRPPSSDSTTKAVHAFSLKSKIKPRLLKSDGTPMIQFGEDPLVKWAATFQTLFSMCLTIVAWAKARTFGVQSYCVPSVKFVIFWHAFSFGTARVLGLVFASSLLLGYIYICLMDLRTQLPSNRRKPNTNNDRSLEQQATSVPPPINPYSWIPQWSRNISSPPGSPPAFPVPNTGSPSTEPPPEKLGLDGMLLMIITVWSVVLAYFIASAELLLQRNPLLDDSNSQWSFGQILALIAPFPSLMSVAMAFRKHGFRRRHRHTHRSKYVVY